MKCNGGNGTAPPEKRDLKRHQENKKGIKS